MQNELYQRVRRYYRGELSAEERQAFEARLKADPAFAEEARAQAYLYEGIQAAGDAAALPELQALGQKLWEQQARPRRIRKLRSFTLAAAAVLLLLVSLPLLLMDSGPSNQQLVDQFFEPLPAPTSRSTEAPTAEPFLAYQQEDYENAIAAFLRQDAAQRDAQSWLYLGLSYLSLGDAQAALAALEAVPASVPEQYDDASWYRALALLALDRRAEARKVLRSIVERPRTAWKDQAEALLEAC